MLFGLPYGVQVFLCWDFPLVPPPQSPQSQQSPPPQSQSQSPPPPAHSRRINTTTATIMSRPKDAKEAKRKRGDSSSEQATHRQITAIPAVRSRKKARLQRPLSGFRIQKTAEVMVKPRVRSPVIPVISPYRSGQMLMKTAKTANRHRTPPQQTVISAEVGALPTCR